jgi:hypothetical protein
MEKTSMALWGDTKGRFAFTPNALHGASPYIDRLQVDISIPVTGFCNEMLVFQSGAERSVVTNRWFAPARV